MTRLLLEALVALASVSTVLAVRAGEVEVLAARQTGPGNVVVTIALQSAVAPKPSELALQLDNTPPVRAASVASIVAPVAPVWMMLCLDRSGSIGPMVLEGLKTGLNKALVEGRTVELPFKVAIMAFATKPTHLLDFTSDTQQVAAAVQRLSVDSAPGGRTRMHDAIAGGLAALKAQGEGSKRLIVVSDGKDEGSTISAAKLTELAQGPPQIIIDALALGALAQDNSGAISTLAGGSGGRFLPSADLNDVARPLERLIAEAGPAARFDVAFAYKPAPDKRLSESAALEYLPAVGTQSRHALPVVLAALDVQDGASSPPKNGNGDTTINIEVVLRWIRNAPPVFTGLVAALLLVALALLYWRRRAPPATPTTSKNVEIAVAVVSSPPPPPPPRARSHTSVGHTWQPAMPGQPTAILRGVSGTGRGQMVAIDRALFRVGCDPGNDLVLVGDDFASGAHALLRFEAGGLYVEDLGSTNGTHLNGGTFRSATRSLSPGDELRFGHTTFQVLAPQQAAQAGGRSGYEPPPG